MADRSPKRARYSNVERRVWNDGWFQSLSKIPPCGQGLWLYLLTTPTLQVLPGLIVDGEAGMAEKLGWSLEGFRKAFGEVFAEGRAEADWKARLVVVTNAVRCNEPESPNVVRSWRHQWLEVPECSLKVSYYRKLKAFCEGLGKGYAQAFAEAIEDPSPKASRNQEQEQEQEQKKKPAAAPGRVDPDEQSIRERLAAYQVFSILPHELPATLNGRRMMKGTPIAWVLAAIDECADKSVGAGLSAQALQSRLVGFCNAAKRPRDVEPAPSVVPTAEETVIPERPKFDAEAARRATARALAAMSGTGAA